MRFCVRSLMACLAASFVAGPATAQLPAGSATPQKTELERGPKEERKIALTFDADGGDEDLPTLLRILENENIVATFFLTGRWAGEYPACATQIVERGHVIGNHTWGHKDLTKLTDSEIKQEILRVDDRFVSSFGCRYLPLFRAPSGEDEDRILAVSEKLGFQTVRWSVDTLDSSEPQKAASFIESRVLDRSDDELCGAIVLMHVGNVETCRALPVIIHNLRERGFEFVPVSAWIPTLPSAPLKMRTSATPQDDRPRRPCRMDFVNGLHFDEQAVRTVLAASPAISPEHQIPRTGTGGAGLSGSISNHHNTIMRP